LVSGAGQDAGQPRYKPADLAPVLPKLLEGLFGALGHSDSGENEYIMKCIMRVMSFMGKDVEPIAPVALSKLAEILLRVCNNPTQPAFNHYLFEAVAALIKDGKYSYIFKPYLFTLLVFCVDAAQLSDDVCACMCECVCVCV
jgi:hypothetical protein